MIATLGGRFGGYGLYLLRGKPVFLYNFLDLERFRWEGPAALAPGKHTVVFEFTYDGPGFGKSGTGILKMDDREVANRKIPHTIPFIMGWMKLLTWGSIPVRRWMTTTTNYLSASLARSPSSPTSWVRCNSQAKSIKSFSTHSPRREIDQRMRDCGRLTGMPAMSAIEHKAAVKHLRRYVRSWWKLTKGRKRRLLVLTRTGLCPPSS
jgi:hypothetical protein